MNFAGLKRRVERRERMFEGRLQQTRDRWQALSTTWRASWTPLRIVVAGLIGGFLLGRSDPARALGKLGALGSNGSRVLQLVGTLSGLFASLQAGNAAEQAEQAVDKAEGVATDAAAPASSPVPEQAGAPHPAEAATELSEH
jgi:hypothetical protein